MTLRTVLALLFVATCVSGCGVRGSLKAPSAAQEAGTATSHEDGDPGENSAAPAKPHRPFILDGLL